jgi:hypothetical protein
MTATTVINEEGEEEEKPNDNNEEQKEEFKADDNSTHQSEATESTEANPTDIGNNETG